MVAVLSVAALAAGALAACSRAEGEPADRPRSAADRPAPQSSQRGPGPQEGPLVLELFTSQGCSSCPPADRLLGKLASTGALGDRAVAPLSFHVDYWNDLGWADPYSSPAWTERQQQYARSLHDDRVFTPELVVGGAAGMIGSDEGSVTAAIRAAGHPALLPATARWAADAVTISATAPADADVWVAVWEATTSTKVTRGENSGETMNSVHVVRKLERVAAAGQPGQATIKLDPAWHASGAIAFAQRPDRRITASAALNKP
ncbi:MAG TPA: DUF1223 domain-containing protein [Kofleriaceae bacterium]